MTDIRISESDHGPAENRHYQYEPTFIMRGLSELHITFTPRETRMTGKLEGKVAFITGAARGQGRAHAIAMAREGADIIAVDICRDIPSNPYPLATPDDLAETERSIKEIGRQVLARVADVRERHELRDAVEAGVANFGKIDIVVANAGILPMAMGRPHDAMSFVDASDVDLLGVMNTVAVTVPHLPNGASVIITGSTAGMIRGTTDNPNMGPGGRGYGWSKRVIIEYVEEMSLASGRQDDPRQRDPPDQLQHPSVAERRDVQHVPARPDAGG